MRDTVELREAADDCDGSEGGQNSRSARELANRSTTLRVLTIRRNGGSLALRKGGSVLPIGKGSRRR